MALDFLYQDGARVTGEVSLRWRDVRFSLPVTYSWCTERDVAFLDAAIRVDCYPFEDLGLFLGVDAIRYGRYFGRGSPEKRNVFPTSLYIGWSQEFSHFLIEPRLILTDPAGLCEEEMSRLSAHFFMYSRVYASLSIGAIF